MTHRSLGTYVVLRSTQKSCDSIFRRFSKIKELLLQTTWFRKRFCPIPQTVDIWRVQILVYPCPSHHAAWKAPQFPCSPPAVRTCKCVLSASAVWPTSNVSNLFIASSVSCYLGSLQCLVYCTVLTVLHPLPWQLERQYNYLTKCQRLLLDKLFNCIFLFFALDV